MHFSSICRSAVIGFYLANEGLPILENAGDLGLKWHRILRNALERLKNKEDYDDDENADLRQ